MESHARTAVADGVPHPATVTATRRIAQVRKIALSYAMVWVLIALAVVSQIAYPGFFEIGNLRNVLVQNAPVGIVAVGMTFVMIGGGFDLSVGALYAAGAVIFASFANQFSLPLAAALALAVGVGAGLVNGLVVTRLRVNPFIATLGTSSIFGGAALLYSNSSPVLPTNENFDWLGSAEIAAIPVSILVLVTVLAIGGAVLSRTVYGRSLYAIGGNSEASRLAGIRVDGIRATTYMITGVLAVLAGMIIASRTGVGQADIGASMALDAIAIVVIGGTSLFGGEGAMWRTLVGLLILATINNLFDSLGLEEPAQLLVKGAILIIAVALDAFTRTRP